MIRKHVNKERSHIICKQEAILRTYEKWMNKISQQRSVSAFLLKSGYRKIGVYGIGRLGKSLYNFLTGTDVSVTCLIDCNISYYEGARCYKPDEKLPYMDLLIVTVSVETDNIVKEIETKVSCPVKSLNEILFML